MSDRTLVALVAAIALAARMARPVPTSLLAALVGVAVVARLAGDSWGADAAPVRRLVAAALAAAVALGVSGRAAHQVGALADAPTGPVAGAALVRSDPERNPWGAVTADVSLAGRRYLLEATGEAGSTLSVATVGSTVAVRGTVRRFERPADWQLSRHLAGRLRATEVAWVSGPGPLWAPAMRVRGLLARGAASLPPDTRAVFEGLVLGDDRGQREAITFRYRAAGLSHLLVVSGSNVAFVLAAARPLTRRVPLRSRWLAVAVVLLLFGTVVRWEPSVLRAVAMAGVATVADGIGRPAAALRTLGVALVVLLCVDPLLVRSVGFQLSVAATIGLTLGARPLGARLPGPRWMAEPLGVVVAAQAGCLPLLVAYFGMVPAAGLVTNLVAVPVAGWVMVWGVTAGLAAGLLPPAVAALLHLPTRVLIGALDAIAAAGADPRWPRWDALGVVLATVAAVVALRAGSRRTRLLAAVHVVVPLVVLAAACGWAIRPPAPGVVSLGAGAELAVGRSSEVVVVVGGAARTGRVAEALERRRVRRIDVLVVTAAGPVAGGVAADLRDLWPVGTVLVPPGTAVAVPSDRTVELVEGTTLVGSVRLRARAEGHGGAARWAVTAVT